MQVQPDEYARLPLRAHALLADVPLHDVWAIDLPGGGPGRTVLDLRRVAPIERVARASFAVRWLFGLRVKLGWLFRWDDARERPPRDSFLPRLSEADHAASLVPPGTRDGGQWTLFVSRDESIAELRNATVHAFVVTAMVPREDGYRAFWAIYVRPVGRVTAWYMRLIDPFRRTLIYPAMLREMRRLWAEAFGPR